MRSGTISASCASPCSARRKAGKRGARSRIFAARARWKRSPEGLSAKAANSTDQNRELQNTYLPHNAAVVRIADAARVKGRQRMRGGGTKN
jgi:hypothetical protein